MVGCLDNIQVVLDDKHGIAGIPQSVQDIQELLDVGEVQTGRGFIQDVQRSPGAPPGKLPAELDPLRLPPGERCGRLGVLEERLDAVCGAGTIERIASGCGRKARTAPFGRGAFPGGSRVSIPAPAASLPSAHGPAWKTIA